MNKFVVFLFTIALIVGCGLQIPSFDHDGAPVPQNSGSGGNGGGNDDNGFENPVVPPPPGGNPPPADPNIITYKIPAGTSSKSWASEASPIVGKVGQTLRVVNEDSIAHRIHTGGKPFPHTNNIAAGATVDFKLVQAVTTKAVGPETYEHNFGTGSPVFFKVDP